MKFVLKILGWIAMATFIALVVVVIDVQRAVSEASRVKIEDEALAAAIVGGFPFESHYLSKVTDGISRAEGQMLLDQFPRHIQLPMVLNFTLLSAKQKASLIASHAPMTARSGQPTVGLEGAAKEWLGVPLISATPQQIESLSQHRRSGKAAKRKSPNSDRPTPATAPQR